MGLSLVHTHLPAFVLDGNAEVSLVCVIREREQHPRFAQPGSFEYEYAMRWKALMEMEKQQFEQVDRNIKEAQEKLEQEMEAARHEHQVMLMRQGELSTTPNHTPYYSSFPSYFIPSLFLSPLDLLRRQEELRRMEEAHNQEVQKRKQMELRQEEERRRREEELRAHTEELIRRQQGTGQNFGEKVHTRVHTHTHRSMCSVL